MNQQQTDQVNQVIKDNPDVPAEIFDIEASPEVAEMYRDMESQLWK